MALPAALPGALRDALAGRYTLIRELGKGGMATVYLAEDCRHDRPVALKVLDRAQSAAIGSERFEREIRVLARLRHPFILPLHDSGEAAGALYFVMPYIDGESLRTRLEREGRLTLEQSVPLIRQVADALDYAHGEGVIHRDIKPENILLSRHGHALLADFGIARAAPQGPETDIGLTQTGMAIGTAAYMSPEQALGETGLDRRSDVYSLGCVVYEMLAGRLPFSGTTAFAVIAQRLSSEAPSLDSVREDLPGATVRAVARAIARDAEARFSSAGAFVAALVASEPAGATGPLSAGAAPGLSIAVLPVGRSPDPETEFFSDGMTEELINALAKVQGLRVVSRTSTFAFKAGEVPVGEIGARLRVGFVLEANVRRAGRRLRVTARLVEVGEDATRWSETYERELADVFAVQDEITGAIVETITQTLELGRLPGPAPVAQPQTLEAYDLYLLGRHHWNKRTQKEMQRALELFQQAAEADPGYAPAYSGIADASALLASWQFKTPEEMYPQAVAAARRAIALDPESADAHASLGFIKQNWEWDWEGVILELGRAIALNANHETAHRWLSAFLAGIGRYAEAIPLARRALELDPLSVLPRMNLGIIHFLGARFEDAVAEFRRVIELDAGFVRAHIFLGGALSFLDRHEEAIAAGRRGAELAKQLPITLVPLGASLARAGRREEARALLAPVAAGLDPIYAGMVYAALGEEESALGALEQGITKRSDWMYSIAAQPYFRQYHGKPRFRELLRTMKLRD